MKKWVLLIAVILAQSSLAFDIGVGIGSSAATDGRLVPALGLDFSTSSIITSFMSTGVETTAYSHNFYQMGLFFKFLEAKGWGKIEAGFGLGGYYTKRELYEVNSESNGSVGAGFRINWNFLGPLFIGIEGLLALNFNHPWLLPTSDAGYFVVGLRTY